MFDIAICTAGLASGVAPYSIVIDASLEIGDARIIGGSPLALVRALALSRGGNRITRSRTVRRICGHCGGGVRHAFSSPVLGGVIAGRHRLIV